MLQKIRSVVFRDVKNENETKKVSVILRLNSIAMCIYFLCLLCTFFVTGEFQSVILCVPCFCAHAAAFYLTYLNRTKLAVLFAQFIAIIWIIGFIREFGWDCGVQHFIFALLVLNFATTYTKLFAKIIMGAVFCVFRLALYVYTKLYDPVFILDSKASAMFQIINSVFIFAIIIMILSVFAEDSMLMEKKLVSYNEKLHKLASMDALTGLMNRRGMREYLEKREAECRAGKINSLSLAMGDIDLFKRINDTYGHECGDAVLSQLAFVFQECIGKAGEIGRWGGEEFLFAFCDVNGDEAMVILDELQKEIRRLEIPFNNDLIKITMTFGLGEYDFQRGVDCSINEVDEKLYLGKATGRDKIVY